MFCFLGKALSKQNNYAKGFKWCRLKIRNHIHIQVSSAKNLFVLKVLEVSRFRVDEFVKFDEFNEKLPVHTDWLNGPKILLKSVPIHYW